MPKKGLGKNRIMFGSESYIAVNPTHSEILNLIKHMRKKSVRFLWDRKTLYVVSSYSMVHIELLERISKDYTQINDWIFGTAEFDTSTKSWIIQKSYKLLYYDNSVHYSPFNGSSKKELPSPLGSIKSATCFEGDI